MEKYVRNAIGGAGLYLIAAAVFPDEPYRMFMLGFGLALASVLLPYFTEPKK